MCIGGFGKYVANKLFVGLRALCSLSDMMQKFIIQGITRALAGHSRTVRLPAHIHHRLGVINRASEVLTTEGTPVSVKVLLCDF